MGSDHLRVRRGSEEPTGRRRRSTVSRLSTVSQQSSSGFVRFENTHYVQLHLDDESDHNETESKNALPLIGDIDGFGANEGEELDPQTGTEAKRLADGDSNEKKKLPPILERVPNTAFGMAMGIAGQAILWKRAGVIFDSIPPVINIAFWITGCVELFLFATPYVWKAMFRFPLVLDEIRDGSRVHFFNMPHLVMIMLTISVPPAFIISDTEGTVQQIVWTVAFFFQLTISYSIYDDWMFSDHSNISKARPQFLLSIVGWFFLALLGAVADIERTWGLPLPVMCLGLGLMFYIMVVIAVFNGLHVNPSRGSPGLFLLIAPPSVGVVASNLLTRKRDTPEVNLLSGMLFGWSLGLLVLLMKIGPKIQNQPPTLGAYWAYVFPLSAVATAAIQIEEIMASTSSKVLVVILITLSEISVVVVCARQSWHTTMVIRGKAEWADPLLTPEKLRESRKYFAYNEIVEDIETA